MSGFLGPILTLALKDILLEIRTKEIVSSVLLFAFLAVIISSTSPSTQRLK